MLIYDFPVDGRFCLERERNARDDAPRSSYHDRVELAVDAIIVYVSKAQANASHRSNYIDMRGTQVLLYVLYTD